MCKKTFRLMTRGCTMSYLPFKLCYREKQCTVCFSLHTTLISSIKIALKVVITFAEHKQCTKKRPVSPSLRCLVFPHLVLAIKFINTIFCSSQTPLSCRCISGINLFAKTDLQPRWPLVSTRNHRSGTNPEQMTSRSGFVLI